MENERGKDKQDRLRLIYRKEKILRGLGYSASILVAIVFLVPIYYLGLAPHWKKANIEAEQKILLERQVEIDEAILEEMKSISTSLQIISENFEN